MVDLNDLVYLTQISVWSRRPPQGDPKDIVHSADTEEEVGFGIHEVEAFTLAVLLNMGVADRVRQGGSEPAPEE